MVKVEPNASTATSDASEPLRRSPRRSTSPRKPKRTIKIVKKTFAQNGQQSSPNGQSASPGGKSGRNSSPNKNGRKKSPKKSKKKEKAAEIKKEPLDPNAPLQMSLPTRGQKRRALR